MIVAFTSTLLPNLMTSLQSKNL